MSSSVFKEYLSDRNEDGGSAKFDSNLVVFINKNGTVTVDHSALQDLLVNDATNTSVSVIRVGSPTPSLERELNEQEELEKELAKADLDSENESGTDGSQHQNEEEDDADLEEEDATTIKKRSRKNKAQQEKIPNVSLMVENYYNPAEAKKLASEILSIAGITNPLHMSVDFDFVRYVISNDHCYSLYQRVPINDSDDHIATTNTTPVSSQNQSDLSKSLTTKSKRKITHVPIEKPIELSEDEDVEQKSDDDEDYTESDQSYVSPSESDRDSDLDFSVNERNSKGRKINKTRPIAKLRPNKQTHVVKKRQSATGDVPQGTDDDHKRKSPKKKTPTIRGVESLEVTPVAKSKIVNTPGPSTSTPIARPETSLLIKDYTIPRIVSVSMNPKTFSKANVQQANPSKAIHAPSLSSAGAYSQKSPLQLFKNHKKTNVPAETALFSDMNSLFSTPDIIKKVPGSKPETPSNNRVTNISVITLPPVTLTPIPLSNTNSTSNHLGKTLFMTLAQTQNRQRIIQGQNIVRSTNSPIVLNNPNQNIVFSSVAQRQQPLQATALINNTRTVVNVIGNPTTSGMQMIGRPGISPIRTITSNVQIPNTNMSTVPFASGGIIANETPILTDADLLEGLGHVDDALSDDLMQHVAQLVEDKNLQEVIDQQVLGVPLNILDKPIITPVHTNATCSSSFVTTTPIKPKPNKMPAPKMPVTPSTPTQVVPMKPRPEPIQIVRSDGRVITLPPIEAPTTRGAKRRAQNQNPNDTTSSPAPATPPPKLDISTPKEVSRRSSVAPDRSPSVVRKSVNTKTNTVVPSVAQNAIEIIELDDDLEEDGSDGSYNSEDDPYRIWCICRQPHNNRFMICCDKCEEWFHGKCVNVTKAMGVELEQRGVEWVCPNCIKKHPHLQQRQLAVLSKKLPSRKPSYSSLVQELSATASILDNSLQSCIVCKKAARTNSVYCSDDCIRIHAHTTKNVPSPVTATQSTTIQGPITVKSVTTTASTIVSATPAIPITKITSVHHQAKIISNAPRTVSIQNAQKTNTLNQSKTATTSTQLKTTMNQQNSKASTSGHKVSSSQDTPKIITSNEPHPKRNHHVDVYEPSTGRCLTGSSAPSADNLKQWLKDHPTFKVVQPGSANSAAFKAKKQQLQQLAKTMAQEEQSKLFAVTPHQQKIQTTLKIGPSKKIQIINPQTQSPAVLTHSPQASIKPVVNVVKHPQQIASPTLSAGTPRHTQSSGSKSASSLSKTTPPTVIKRKSDVQLVSTSGRTSVAPEPIRVNVQRTLKEQLTLRMDEQTDAKFPTFTDGEIEAFVKETEHEIYILFNKDTGVKYRAKYRSLMFNLKDRKNMSLFLKICDRSITPQQLVRMSAEELASQELAQWRENENKHQLEMIKKSELDILACSKTYVLKTHKGEEVIEGSISDRVSLDPMVSVEDVVSVLNNTAVNSSSDITDEKQSPAKDNRIDSRFERYHSAENVISSKNPSTSSKPSAAHGSSGSSKRGRSPSSHSEIKKNKSSSSSSKHRKRSRDHRSPSDSDRSKDKSKNDPSSDIKDKHKSSKSSSSGKDKKRDDNKKRDEHKKRRSSDGRIIDPPKTSKSVVQNYNIIDEILKAQMNSNIKLDDSIEKEKVSGDKTKVPDTQINKPIEPSSTVTIPTPPESHYQKDDSPIDSDSPTIESIWSGSLFMVDVATLFVSVSPIVGESSNVASEIPDELNVVGRINPEIVWDYISKIKKSVNKDILLVRFRSSLDTQDNIDAYILFYHYLTHRKRFGVIKIKSTYIKDFYIIPLAAHKSMPSVLPNPGKEFDVDREDMLVGIIVLNINVAAPMSKKRVSSMPPRSATPKLSRLSETVKTNVSTLVEDARYTPPCSPKVATSSFKAAQKTLVKPLDTVMDDGDEPYSPGGSDEDDRIIPYSTLSHPSAPLVNPIIQSLASSSSNSRDQLSPTAHLDQFAIQRKMEELTRQIEAQKMEIAGMLHDAPGASIQLDEPYSPTSMLGADKSSDTLSGIAIPANLKEILNSLKGSSGVPMSYGNEEYDPTAVVPSAAALSYQSMNAGYVPAANTNTTSKLAQLTDEELLNMVPDDAREHLVMPTRTPNLDLSGGSAPGMNRPMYHLQSTLHPPGVDEEYVP